MREEDKEELASLIQHPGYSVLHALILRTVQNMERDVVRYNLETGSDKALSFLKCRAEGAAKLVSAVELQLEALKAKQ